MVPRRMLGDTMKKRHRKHGHEFNGEMRIRINRRIYPNVTEEEVMELAQRAMEGEQVEGIQIVKFEVRGNDKTEEISDYDFASAFMRSAKRSGE